VAQGINEALSLIPNLLYHTGRKEGRKEGRREGGKEGGREGGRKEVL
jgi:hypothetical protein